jgi:tight adherence protein B
MSDINPIAVLLPILVLFTVAYACYVFLTEYEKTVTDLQKGEMQKGDMSLAELSLSITPSQLLILRILGALAGFLFGFFALNVIFGAFFMIAAFVAPAIYLNNLRRKRVLKIEQQLVEGLELLGNSLKSGLTIQQAVELVVKEFPAPLSQEFALVLSESKLGVDFTDALENMALRLRSNIVQILAAGVAVTKRVGGDLTVIFANIAQTIREQANIEGKLNAVTAQGRFQGLILGFMPFALCVILYFVEPGHMEVMFSYTIGRWAFASVIIMVILAQLWIRKLLDIDV